MLYARSSTLISVPSSYLRPGFILKVQVRLSSETVPRSVRSGTSTALPPRNANWVGVRRNSLPISLESVK